MTKKVCIILAVCFLMFDYQMGLSYEYYLEVAFDNGKVETLHVSRAVYRKARKGKPKVLSLIRGGFGLPVIKKGI